MKYLVTFIQAHTYEVDADDEDSAINTAYSDFSDEMRRPVCHTEYDDVQVRPVNSEYEC